MKLFVLRVCGPHRLWLRPVEKMAQRSPSLGRDSVQRWASSDHFRVFVLCDDA